MSWWTKIRDTVETPFEQFGHGVKSIANSTANAGETIWNKVTNNPSAAEKRQQNQLITDQVNAYKQQTDLTRQQLNDARAETQVEQRRIQEKQIRSLRRNYRSPTAGVGLLGQGQPATEDMNTKLGG